MATSINSPALNNAIRTDVPAISTILKALAKSDPSVLADLENGTKRLYEGTNGWEFQEMQSGSWVTLKSFNIDAQSVDGYNTSTGATASTIAVRDTTGKLAGDITGNAATATKANALASTLAVNAGGTGATTASDARANLNVPATNHASTTTTHGVGTETDYGHLRVTDSLPSTVTSGVAASPNAVSTGLDSLMDDVITAVSNVHSSSSSPIQQIHTRIDEVSANKADKLINGNGVVRTINGKVADEQGNIIITFDTPEVAQGVSIPIGAIIAMSCTPVNGIEGYILCNGGIVSRNTYADLFAVIGTTYGEGDGATTFGLPDYTGKFLEGGATAGIIHNPGLPNITGNVVNKSDGNSTYGGGTGALRATAATDQSYRDDGGHSGYPTRISIDASLSSSVYGASSTVQPYSQTVVYYMKY